MSFANLKTNRANDIASLVSAAESVGGGGEKKSYADERFWKPTVDKSGNGYAVIRFLPSADESELAWTQYWDHGFKGATGRWYIEKSLTTINKDDPVGELNTYLWNTGSEANKEIARSRKRRLHYVSNIYVVSDSANPENEGKTFLYQYGKKIFAKIMDVMEPEFEDEKPINPFDFWEGANFKLKIRKVEGYRNYDKSEFDSPSALLGGDDDKLEKVFKSLHSLKEYTDPDSFKTYEELSRKLHDVLGDDALVNQSVRNTETVAAPAVGAVKESPAVDDDDFDYEFKEGDLGKSKSDDDDGEEDVTDFLARIANED